MSPKYIIQTTGCLLLSGSIGEDRPQLLHCCKISDIDISPDSINTIKINSFWKLEVIPVIRVKVQFNNC
ncbi:hypothetical protein ABKV19_006450 [Rosa sericea]